MWSEGLNLENIFHLALQDQLGPRGYDMPFKMFCDWGLETWLTDLGHWVIFKKSWDQFLAPTGCLTIVYNFSFRDQALSSCLCEQVLDFALPLSKYATVLKSTRQV